LNYTIDKQVKKLPKEAWNRLTNGGAMGLEKEALRVSSDGGISQQKHPEKLGSTLTHPYITTDYSEALTELITPPVSTAGEALAYLSDLQKFVYDHLEDEVLWATSMPCALAGGGNIPLADYGPSNAGLMKTIYRRGLGHRYGRTMQVIAGVHFNFSFDQAFWPVYQDQLEYHGDSQSFINQQYLGLTRNLLRFGWLIPYLFGASPAVCKSFLAGKPTRLDEFDAYTYYEPFATSLRMGDIGYTNSKEKGVGIKANYNSLEKYIDSLTHAIETSSPVWERIALLEDGEYQQLNTNILQIENEYYSTVRPKQVLRGMEKPTTALRRRGVQYIELRSLDVNAFHPLGVSEDQLRFLRIFMIFCLLLESPLITPKERQEIDDNIAGAAHRGRDRDLTLLRHGDVIKLRDWAEELCEAMSPVAEMLDQHSPSANYSKVLADQLEVVRDADRTPSARILAEMVENGEGFFHFAQRKSLEHQAYFKRCQLTAERHKQFQEDAERSIRDTKEVESSDSVDLPQFLEDYFAQV